MPIGYTLYKQTVYSAAFDRFWLFPKSMIENNLFEQPARCSEAQLHIQLRCLSIDSGQVGSCCYSCLQSGALSSPYIRKQELLYLNVKCGQIIILLPASCHKKKVSAIMTRHLFQELGYNVLFFLFISIVMNRKKSTFAATLRHLC